MSNLRSWDSHILLNEQSYEEYQISHKYFICSVLNKIHQRVQRFLMRCQEGWEEINLRLIDFRDLQDRIVSEDYHVEKPAWAIEKESKENKSNFNNNDNGNRNKRFKADNKEISQEINYEKDSRMNIPDSSIKYGEVFTAENRKEFGKLIKNEDGKVICHMFHIKGICDSNCRFKTSHKKLSSDKTKELLEFVDFAFSKHPKLKSSSGKKNSNESQG